MTQAFTEAPTQRAVLPQKATHTPFCLIPEQFTAFLSPSFPAEVVVVVKVET